MSTSHYIPALRFSWLTPLYDPLLRWGMREDSFRAALVRQAAVQPGDQVLDLGCGTGTLTILFSRSQPAAHLIGLDGDRAILAIAATKGRAAGTPVTWVHGLSYALPLRAESVDRVVTSLVLHHLTSTGKQRTFAEVYRVLRPGGEFHVFDFGPPHSLLGRSLAPLFRRLEEAGDNLDGRLPEMFAAAGFTAIAETARFVTVVGDLALLRMVKSPTG